MPCGTLSCLGIMCLACYAPGCCAMGMGCVCQKESVFRRAWRAMGRGCAWLGRKMGGACVGLQKSTHDKPTFLTSSLLEETSACVEWEIEEPERSAVWVLARHESTPLGAALDADHQAANAWMQAASVYQRT